MHVLKQEDFIRASVSSDENNPLNSDVSLLVKIANLLNSGHGDLWSFITGSQIAWHYRTLVARHVLCLLVVRIRPMRSLPTTSFPPLIPSLTNLDRLCHVPLMSHWEKCQHKPPEPVSWDPFSLSYSYFQSISLCHHEGLFEGEFPHNPFVSGLSDEELEKILRFYRVASHCTFSHVHLCLSPWTWYFM